MKVLSLTNMYPTADMPAFGTFVESEVQSLRQCGVEVDVLFINGRRRAINYLWGIPRLWYRLLKQRYDLIHAHYVFTGFVARAQFLYPVVLTHHGVEVLQGWQAILSRIITPLMDQVIVRSPEMKNRLRCGEAAVIPAGVDLDLFKPMPQQECRHALDLSENKKYILWVGEYLRQEKRFDIVTEAVARVKQRIPDAEFVLVTGKPHSVIPAYMNACDVLLLVSDAEGSPNVVKEAMACNLPIVSVPVGDVPSVINGTEGCFLCKQNAVDVADKLELALLQTRRTNGRENIVRLDLDNASARIIEVYQRALAEGKSLIRSRPEKLAKLE